MFSRSRSVAGFSKNIPSTNYNLTSHSRISNIIRRETEEFSQFIPPDTPNRYSEWEYANGSAGWQELEL